MTGSIDNVYLTGPQVRARYGNVSDMTLWRWLRDPAMGFPKPTYINKRRYWRLSELEGFERSRVLGRTTAA